MAISEGRAEPSTKGELLQEQQEHQYDDHSIRLPQSNATPI